jgi:predicted metal-dependent phosphoesterase TrpH
MLKADFHVHTKYSMDCNTALESIIRRCRDTGITCVNIADHGTVEGALELQKIAPFKIIVSEEILTPHGEIMGMFLKETIPGKNNAEEAIAAIKQQGGLVCIPHPFDALRGLKVGMEKFEKLAAQIDVIEVFNARCIAQKDNVKAQDFASAHEIPGTAGSDAHTIEEIGGTYVEMPEFSGAQDFLEALKQGNIFSHKASIRVHFSSTWTKIKKSI